MLRASSRLMHWVVSFAKPFRMPGIYLRPGLFRFRVIDRDWRTHLDRKVEDVAVLSLIVTAVAVAVLSCCTAYRRNTWARFHYERPERLKIERKRRREPAPSAAPRAA
jgi:uncharacterized membrane protein YcfT